MCVGVTHLLVLLRPISDWENVCFIDESVEKRSLAVVKIANKRDISDMVGEVHEICLPFPRVPDLGDVFLFANVGCVFDGSDDGLREILSVALVQQSLNILAIYLGRLVVIVNEVRCTYFFCGWVILLVFVQDNSH